MHVTDNTRNEAACRPRRTLGVLRCQKVRPTAMPPITTTLRCKDKNSKTTHFQAVLARKLQCIHISLEYGVASDCFGRDKTNTSMYHCEYFVHRWRQRCTRWSTRALTQHNKRYRKHKTLSRKLRKDKSLKRLAKRIEKRKA